MPGIGLAFLTPDSDNRGCRKLLLLKRCVLDIGHSCDIVATICYFVWATISNPRCRRHCCHRATGSSKVTDSVTVFLNWVVYVIVVGCRSAFSGRTTAQTNTPPKGPWEWCKCLTRSQGAALRPNVTSDLSIAGNKNLVEHTHYPPRVTPSAPRECLILCHCFSLTALVSARPPGLIKNSLHSTSPARMPDGHI